MANEQPPPTEEKDFWDGCAGFWEGLCDSVESAAEGIWGIVSHPIDTVEGLYDAVTNPGETWDNICDSLSGFWEDNWTNGDLESRSMVIGRIIGEVALCVVGTKGIDKAAKSVKAMNIAGKAKVGANVSKYINKPLKAVKSLGKGRTFISKYKIPVDKNGFTMSNLKLGNAVHKEYFLNKVNGITRFKEFRLPSGKRVDYIDFSKKIIYELKPNNPKQILQGKKQLEMYLKEVESIHGPGWKTVLDTY